MSIKLIAFDLDGTFLDNRKHIPPENLRALYEAAELGVELVPATGRIIDGIPEEIRALPFVRRFISINGALVYDREAERVIHRAEIPVSRALEFYNYEDSFDCLYDCYMDDWGYMERDMLRRVPDMIRDAGMIELIQRLRIPVDGFKAMLCERGGSLQKLQVYFSDSALRLRQLRELPEMFPDMRFTSSMPFNIEINSMGASKGQALTALCSDLGIDISEAMAIGDGGNDADMLIAAGRGVAMDNALVEIKALADSVTDTNENAGFAKAVREALVR